MVWTKLATWQIIIIIIFIKFEKFHLKVISTVRIKIRDE